MKKLSLMVAFLAITSVLFAQTKDQKWSVGLHTNFTEYQGDLGNEFFTFKDIDPGIGISAAYYLSPTFDLTAKVSYFDVDYKDTYGTYSAGKKGYAQSAGTPYGDWGFNGDMWASALNLKFKLNNGWLLKEEVKVAPFAKGGVGVTHIHSESTRNTRSSKQYTNLALYYGAGLNFRLSEKFNMVLEAGVYNPMTDVYDGIDPGTVNWEGAGKSNDEFLQYSIGFTYNLGKKKDTDGDGIADKKDKCPNTPIGVTVDENGCSIDTDSDGTPDYLDNCPDIAGTILGCPDTDKDGIMDPKDKCPKVAGLKELQGCPDKDDDNDGILNLVDKCPNTPANVKVNKKGCPIDTDGDGILDYLDKCPKQAGPAKTHGCPVQEQINNFAKNIYFNFNKASLKADSYATLDKIVEILKGYSSNDYKVVINGYTDSKGNNSYNKRLSEKRANTVMVYLTKHGIPSSLLTSRGYGEANPIATNETAEGRAQNRRTEIIIE